MAEAAAKLNRYCQLVGAAFQVGFEQLPNGAFKCQLTIPDHDHVAQGVASAKKTAQQSAVHDMVGHLTEFHDLEGVLVRPVGPAAKKQKLAEAKSAVSAIAQMQPQAIHKQPAQKAQQQPQIQNPQNTGIPAKNQDDGMGNFTLEIARSHMNQELWRMKQKHDIQVTQEGTPHQPCFRASLTFRTRDGKRHDESYTGTSKKAVQNELALKICRKLFASGYIKGYKRNSTKGTFWDNVKDSKYYEAGSFGLGLQPQLKAKLHNYLNRMGYGVPDLGGPGPGPDSVLWEQASDAELSNVLDNTIAALPWCPPGRGPAPWPAPKGQTAPDLSVAEMAAESSSQLPIAARYEEIVRTVATHQVSIIQGSTGSGKTTQVPQYILDAQDGHPKTIIVTQPRRLAAITVARRVAAERGEALGGTVGFAVRFDNVWPNRVGGICYMTSGLLLKRLHRQGLCGVSHVIVDEVHERDLDNDVLLGLLRTAAVAHPLLKIVLMSATIDARKFQSYMGALQGPQAGLPPIISCEGRCFPVTTLFLEDIIEKMAWRPTDKKWKEKDPQKSMNTCDPVAYSQQTMQTLAALPEQQIPLELVRDLLSKLLMEGTISEATGSVLVFLPTWAMMSLLSKLLQAESTLRQACKVILLHSQVPKHEQMEAFKPAPSGMCKVILATNIAESSITIQDVTVVIDSCRVKLAFFAEGTRLSRNEVVWTGRQNMEQRKGRAGRTREGLCFRLCTKLRFEQGIEQEVPPELTRMPLVGAALLVKSLDLGSIAGVLSQCPDAPSAPALQHAISELQLVQALDKSEQLTNLGRILARLPVDPHVGLALLMGHWFFGLGDAMATICAAMSFDEPFHFEQTAGYLPYAVAEKYKGTHKHSDQFLLGLVHQEYGRLLQVQGQAAADNFVSSESLHPAIMRQAFDGIEQLRGLLQSDALGAMLISSEEGGLVEDDFEQASKERSHNALRDWGQQDWQWGAVLLMLATALPFLAVHQEKRHVWVSEEIVGAVHKGSVSCCKNSYAFPSPLFAFLDQVKDGGWKPPRCRQLTNLPPLLALLRPFAAGNVTLDTEDGSCAIVGGWIPVGPVPADTVQLLLGLRRRLENALVECADQIATEGGPAFAAGGGMKDQELIIILKELLKYYSFRFREGAAAPVSTGSASGAKQGSKGNATLFKSDGPAWPQASMHSPPQAAAPNPPGTRLAQPAGAVRPQGTPGIRLAQPAGGVRPQGGWGQNQQAWQSAGNTAAGSSWNSGKSLTNWWS